MHPTIRLLFGASLTLALVMGVGRFLYTPLLPLMQREFGFGADIAGLIASANFAGYLAGSLLASFTSHGKARLMAFRLGLITSVATTLLMGVSDELAGWLTLRAISGAASAFAMISAAGLTAEALSRVGEEGRLAWVFGGVGSGIAVSGLIVQFGVGHLEASSLWLLVGAISLGLMPVALGLVGDRQLPQSDRIAKRVKRVARPLPFWPLFVNYTCEGLGYSVFATFIVALIKARPGIEALGDFVWIIVGLAGLPSCLFWSRMAERFGFSSALACAYVAQIVGVALPILVEAPIAAVIAAILFGGTFLAITLLTLPLGRQGLGGRGFAVLTAGFGLGQMAGPLIAGWLVAGTADYSAPMLGSAGVLAFGLLALVYAIRTRREVEPAG